MLRKLTTGRIEIAVFGEISTGKSALINALVGQAVAQVDVQGGWTKEVWHVPWEGSGYCVPGLADSQVVLVDTPGLNEVGGQDRAPDGEPGRSAGGPDPVRHRFGPERDRILGAGRAGQGAQADHPGAEQDRSVLAGTACAAAGGACATSVWRTWSRRRTLSLVAADPREVEYVIESSDGTQRREWRKPDPDVEQLKVRILEVLAAEGKELLTLNAAMYAADKSDRIAAVRVALRDRRAKQVIASYAGLKAVAVAFNPVAVADVLGGTAVDMTMVVTLAHIYGLELSTMHARSLIASIVKAAGWVMLGEMTTHVLSSSFKGLTLGYGTVLTAVPQGAAAGYGSFVVGQAAKYYFEHGSSWGGEAPKTVVRRILQETDKSSVLEQLKDEIKAKMHLNPHAGNRVSKTNDDRAS